MHGSGTISVRTFLSSPRKMHAELYVVEDPHTGVIRYVGVSRNAQNRQQDAWKHRKRNPFQLGAWLRELDIKPYVRIIAIIEWQERFAIETQVITALRMLGYDLVNKVSAYGEHPGHFVSIETRAKIGAANRRRVITAETRAKISVSKTNATNTGKKCQSGCTCGRHRRNHE